PERRIDVEGRAQAREHVGEGCTYLLACVCDTSAAERAVRGDIEDYEDCDHIGGKSCEVWRDNDDRQKRNRTADRRSDDSQIHFAQRSAVGWKRGYDYRGQDGVQLGTMVDDADRI